MAKYLFTWLLTAMTMLSALVGIVYKAHPYIALMGWSLCAVSAVMALIAAAYESLPKPHLIPVGYGRIGNTWDGLLFENDGEAAYNVKPPESVELSGIGTAIMEFDDPGVFLLRKTDGPRCFPLSIKDSSGSSKIDSLRMELALRNVDHVLVSFRYADAKRPTSLRYQTTVKIELHSKAPKGIAVSLSRFSFNWQHLFWG